MAGEFYRVDSESEPKIVHYPDKIETEGIGPCMAVGILNHGTRQGYLGHYVGWDTSSQTLVDRAISEAKKIGDLEVALAGNIPPSREDARSYGVNFEEILEFHKAHGRWALQMVRSKGIKRIQNYLQDDPSKHSYEVVVDTEKRKIEVRKKEET